VVLAASVKYLPVSLSKESPMRLATLSSASVIPLFAATLITILGISLGASAGVVTIVSQNSFVDVTAPGIDGGPTREQQQHSAGLGGFGGNASIVDPQFGLLATATQDSNITLTANGGATISSLGSAVINNISQSARPESFFQVVFDITDAARYTLTYDQSNSTRFTPSTATFSGPSGLGALPPGLPGGFSGDLATGRYTLTADTSSGSTFDVRLDVSPTASAVPLPPAVWTGLGMFTVLTLTFAGLRMRRARQTD